MQTYVFIVVALIAGGLVPAQSAINAQLGIILKHPLLASLTNFVVGMLAVMLILAFIRPELPTFKTLQSIPAYLFLGGLMGATFITVVLILLPKIGATNTLMAMVVGQFLVSILIDHYGLLHAPVLPISTSRVLGAMFLLTGLYLVQRGT